MTVLEFTFSKDLDTNYQHRCKVERIYLFEHNYHDISGTEQI